HNHPLALYMEHIRRRAWREVGELLVDSARKVAACGAEFAVSPDNTIHQAFPVAEAGSPIPWLHIGRVVGRAAQRRGYGKLGILGTRYLVEGPVYPDALEPLGIEAIIPPEEDRERVNAIIFDELVKGELHEASRLYINEVMGRLASRGADAAVLGCTEIPLLVDPQSAPLPTLDSTRLLARAAIRESLA
ncbi:MAG: amino acid racemase, partial [Candidatus Brocadiaceae bacterium]